MNYKNFFKLPKNAVWLLPGLQIKRWVSLVFVGSLLLMLGTAITLNLHPVHMTMEFVRYLAQKFPANISGPTLIAIGLLIFYFGWKNTNLSILDAIDPREKSNILETLYKRRKLNKGPKIVAIGGGTGLSTILRGLKNITNNITAVVTVGDDGGSSGRLRDEMGVLPPGDIRNCIAALANEEELVTELFQYRFKSGKGLEGHSFGNLFLSALCSITGDMVSAVKESSKVLSIRGRVLPSTLDDMKLIAKMEDGREILGESNIPEANGKIQKLECNPKSPKAQKDVIEAIKEADLIVLGPGSLYTSVIPNLLIKEISRNISNSQALKVYICNIMTQPGETDNYSVSDHINAILDHADYPNIIDAVMVNESLPKNLAAKYEIAGSFPVEIDTKKIKELGVKIVKRKLIEENKEGLVRHSYRRLSRALHHWFKQNANDKQEKLEPASIDLDEQEIVAS